MRLLCGLLYRLNKVFAGQRKSPQHRHQPESEVCRGLLQLGLESLLELGGTALFSFRSELDYLNFENWLLEMS